MLLLVMLGPAITASPGSYHRTEEKGVWHRPATDTNTRRLPLVRRSSGSLVTLIQVKPYGCTGVLCWNADSLILPGTIKVLAFFSASVAALVKHFSGVFPKTN